jgi:hypothetical protein
VLSGQRSNEDVANRPVVEAAAAEVLGMIQWCQMLGLSGKDEKGKEKTPGPLLCRPRPHLLCNDYKALLAFVLREAEPGAVGATVEAAGPAGEEASSLALVEFKPCLAAKLGSPNDEVLHGHPLQGRGLEGYTAQKVVNSRWLAEVEAVNKVHRCYDPASWRGRSHYVFWFHDTTFECIAGSFRVELYREGMAAMLTRMCQRLLS